MKKYLVFLLAILTSLAMAGISVSQECGPECYANSIVQKDTQRILNVETCPNSPIIYNEGLTAAVTITPPYEVIATADDGTILYTKAGFSKTVQTMTQTIDTLINPGGMTANKAMQAAWTENQGDKEYNFDGGNGTMYDYEASRIRQTTNQTVYDVYFGVTNTTNPMAVFNADSKLAVISDNLDSISKNTTVDASSLDTNSASGKYSNDVEIDALIQTYVNKMG